MKDIYIVFSSTNYNISKMIRLVTRYQYSHVSISLTEDLSEMYSFARIYQNTPFVGGFVKEIPSRYKDNNAIIRIYKYQISDEKYFSIKEKIKKMYQNKELYKYSYKNALLSVLNKNIETKNKYTCLSFVNEILGFTDYKIKDFEKHFSDVIYNGSFTNYISNFHIDNFEEFTKLSLLERIKVFIRQFFRKNKKVEKMY